MYSSMLNCQSDISITLRAYFGISNQAGKTVDLFDLVMCLIDLKASSSQSSFKQNFLQYTI